MSLLTLPAVIFPTTERTTKNFSEKGINFIELTNNENIAHLAVEPIELYNVLRSEGLTTYFLVYGDGYIERRDKNERILAYMGKLSMNTKSDQGYFKDKNNLYYEVKK